MTSRFGQLGRWPTVAVVVLVAVVGTILTWRFATQPRNGLDLSWQIGLNQAITGGLRFGHDIVWTYGPLGFLDAPTPFVSPASAVAFFTSVLVYVALIAIVMVALWRLLPLWAAALATLVVGRAILFLPPFEAFQFVAFALGIEVLRRDRVAHPWWVTVAAAGFAAVAVLGKVNVGVFLTIGGAVVALSVAPRRIVGLVAYVVALGALVAAGWLALGQQVGDLPGYARDSYAIVSGYSEAMGMDLHDAPLAIAGFVVLAGLVGWAAVRLASNRPRAQAIAIVVLVALLLIALWKHGFVRAHLADSFTALGLSLIVVLPGGLTRRRAMAALAVGVLTVAAVLHPSPVRYFNVVRSAIDFAQQSPTSVMPWRWNEASNETAARLQRTFKLPPAILAEVAGHTTHIDPFAAAIATAYPTLTWRPEPVFQSYSAYTPELDRLNADLLRSPERPERILRRFQTRMKGGRSITFAIDGRDYWFESPEATLERLCRYRETAASQRWQVLAATGMSCGAETAISTVTASRGATVQVPPPPSPNDAVLVRVHGVEDGLLGRIRTTLWRSPDWNVNVDGTSYRLVPGTASDGLLLAVPPAAQGSPPFAFGDPVRTISVSEDGSTGGGDLTYEFVAVPLPPS